MYFLSVLSSTRFNYIEKKEREREKRKYDCDQVASYWNLTILRLKFNVIIQWETNRIIRKKFDYVKWEIQKKKLYIYIYV